LSWNPKLPPALAARGRGNLKSVPEKLTVHGIVLLVIGLLMATSAFERFRIPVGALQVHLYLVLMAPFFLYMVATNIREFPGVPLAALLVFCGMYIISTLSGGGFAYGEVLKICASAATLVTAALMVRSESDFSAGVIGLSVAVGFLAFFNLETADRLGRNLMETGNKNAYSLYALPAMLLAGAVLVQKRHSTLLINGILAVCTFGPLVVIFMGANRSGWLGCALIALMLMILRGFNARGVVIVGVLGYATYFAITNFGTTSVFEFRVKQTLEGSTSDVNRKALVIAALKIGMDNPVVGVSPQQLPFELGREMESGEYSAPHNVLGQLVGGSGLICTAALAFVAISLWRLKPPGRAPQISDAFKAARSVLRMMLVLWAFRGMFTAEILYSPAFSMAIGLLIGLCVTIGRRERAQAGARPPRPLVAYPGIAQFPGIAT